MEKIKALPMSEHGNPVPSESIVVFPLQRCKLGRTNFAKIEEERYANSTKVIRLLKRRKWNKYPVQFSCVRRDYTGGS